MEVVDILALPFLALCLVGYAGVMAWLIFRPEKMRSRLERTPQPRTKTNPSRRRPTSI